MPNYKVLIPSLILAIFALIFIGRGITGDVISQSCCFGPQCSPENMCDSAEPHVENPSRAGTFSPDIYVGIAFILISITIYAFVHFGTKQ